LRIRETAVVEREVREEACFFVGTVLFYEFAFICRKVNQATLICEYVSLGLEGRRDPGNMKA